MREVISGYNTKDEKKLDVLREIARYARMGSLQDTLLMLSGGVNRPADYVGGMLSTDDPKDVDDIEKAYRAGLSKAKMDAIDKLFIQMEGDGSEAVEACLSYLNHVGWEIDWGSSLSGVDEVLHSL